MQYVDLEDIPTTARINELKEKAKQARNRVEILQNVLNAARIFVQEIEAARKQGDSVSVLVDRQAFDRFVLMYRAIERK